LRPVAGVPATPAVLFQRLRQVPRAMSGMLLAHLGVGVFIFGVTMVKAYEVERDVNMAVGDTSEIAGYVFKFRGVRDVEGPNYQAAQGVVEISRDGREIGRLLPEKRVYRVQQNPMTESAIRSSLTGDLYVSLGQATQGDAWIVRLYYKPFITWIWGGCVLMALGGLLAASDRRYRAARREQELPASMAGALAS
jgi:cytochrome c-type biogenesis protein CcmF